MEYLTARSRIPSDLLQRLSAPVLVLSAVLAASAAAQRMRGDERPELTSPPTAAPPVNAPVRAEVRSASPRPGYALAELRRRLEVRENGSPASEVDRWILRFATEARFRSEVQDALGRMSLYQPLIRETLRRHGQPEALIHVAMIESRFNNGAVSIAGATGMWQFMAPTARRYGLEISAYVDERRDPIRASDAAARHFEDLHQEFGSWHLALAAYNAGSGRVSRALRRSGRTGPTDELAYWQVRRNLPGETRDYVPLYLAAAEIARDPAAYGFEVRALPPLAFEEVWVNGGVTLHAVARAVGATAGTLEQLNPHLTRGITPPGRRWPVRVPRRDKIPHHQQQSPTR